MMETYVAIDLETTGFDSAADRIIEIGAVRFDRSGHSEQFRTFVRPGQPIPPAVQALTSISERDVEAAPSIEEVLPRLATFLGEHAVVGHNIQFDLGFLAAAGLPVTAAAFDTYDLASALLPLAGRLQLGAVAEVLGIEMPVAHRALADAEATRAVFVRLLERLEAQPRAVLAELAAIAAQVQWSVRPLIEAALAGATEEGLGERIDPSALGRRGAAATPLPPLLVPRDVATPVTDDDIEALFAAAGRRPDLLAGFQPRAGQRAMARAVARTIAHGGQLAVEAGTGTGKSLAYLLPALLHALRNDDRVVVSTHTLNLQEQLAGHEAPTAAAIVEQVAGVEPGTLRTAVLKGRANYLCRERWAEVRATAAPRNRAEARLHARIAVWLPDTETGELGEIQVPAAERTAWDAVSAGNNDCLSRRCAYVRDGSCFLLRARARAAAAHLVVVNHALLLANAVSGEQVLPPYRHLVIDEAHRLEGVATQQYGSTLAPRDLQSTLEGASGPVARLREVAASGDGALAPRASLTNIADGITLAAASAMARVPELERALRAFVQEFDESPRSGGSGAGAGERQVPVTAARRAQPPWEDIEDAAAQLDVSLAVLGDNLGQARGAVAALSPGSAPGLERAQGELGALADTLSEARGAMRAAVLQATLLQPGAGRIVWVSEGEGGVRAHTAPLTVSQRLADDLYAGRESVVATSATLTAPSAAVAGAFDFSVDSLGLQEPETLAIPSPFDYRRAVLAIVVDDIPTPEAAGYAEAVHRVLAAAAEAAGGRTIALFTSHAALRAAAGALTTPLAARGIGVLTHNVDGPPARLLRTLVEQPRTLLLGTAAFWEGVDVRGEALSQIAIARLPFPVPGDPIYAGRAELYDEPFTEFALPQAVLRFRQGFGRLIRGGDERGVFLLLDRRALTRPYGEAFLDALPECEVRRLPASAVAEAVERWLDASTPIPPFESGGR